MLYLSSSFSPRERRRRECFSLGAPARPPRRSRLAHPRRIEFSREAFPAKRLSNRRAKESRGTLSRSNRSRAARRRRQTGDLRWSGSLTPALPKLVALCHRGHRPRLQQSDAVHNPCHATIRRLPTDRRLRRAIARNASLNQRLHSSVSVGFQTGSSRAKSRGREERAFHSSQFSELKRYRLLLFS